MPIQPTYHHGSLPLIMRGPTRSRGGAGNLDSMSFEILAGREQVEAHLLQLGFVENTRYLRADYHSMWTLPWSDEEENNLTTIATVNCIGLLKDDDKRQRRLSVAGREVAFGPIEKVVLAWSTDETGSEVGGAPLEKVKRRVPKLDSEGEVELEILVTPTGYGTRWNVREAIVVISDTYFTTRAPDMKVAGQNIAPVNPPEPPPYIWGGYNEAMRFNSPQGWVLDNREVTEHFRITDEEGLWEITDTIGYYYPAHPE